MIFPYRDYDVLPVPAEAPYGADAASVGPQHRQAGYAAYLNTATGQFDVIAGAGRHNHENTVVVPGGWDRAIVSLSGDDTFTSTSSPAMPNLSQLYMYSAKNSKKFLNDNGSLLAFRVTGTDDGAVDMESYPAGSSEAGGWENRALCELLHRRKLLTGRGTNG